MLGFEVGLCTSTCDVVKTGNPSSMEPSQMANVPITAATIINGVLPPLSEFKQSMASQSAYDSREKPVTKALLHPPDARSDHESLSTSP
ncbi:hypothetical protein V8E54_005721 [Elaphomyces granulatus]